MLLRRVIPCLDVKDGRVVKGVRFVDLTDEGDPPELAKRYAEAGADEICFLDISAAPEGRGTLLDIVERTASQVFVPLSVGGGVRSALEMRDVLRAGADKVAINTAAVDDPDLVKTCARRFGSQCVVISVDARANPAVPGTWEVVVQGGRKPTGLDALEWIDRCVENGAGEVLLTSIDRDGTQEGFDIELLQTVTSRVHVPVIASGGAGTPADMTEAVAEGHADAVLAASIFHRDIHSIAAVKADMAAAGVPVRITEETSLMDHKPSRSLDPAAVSYGPDGLVAAVVQDADDGRVLMVAWQDAEAIEATVASGEAHFHSRSRDVLWRKGETSGNTLAVVSMELDCDADAVLIRARPAGPTCHTEARSCFDLEPGARAATAATAAMAGSSASQGFAWLEQLWATIDERARTRPQGSYTSSLLDAGVDATARKVAEEATEVVMAAKDDEVAERLGAERPREELAGELADLLYHSLVLCAERGLPPAEVIETLKERHGA